MADIVSWSFPGKLQGNIYCEMEWLPSLNSIPQECKEGRIIGKIIL